MTQHCRPDIIDDISTAAWWRGLGIGIALGALSMEIWSLIFRGLQWAWGAA